ncbi:MULTISPECIES: hypothetical protein [Streptomyces]|uniref:hypothetical protein n=1 Tax=Streptomyces TaxID=1883 RepID=UPI0015C51146|nr:MULTISPECIES: hypothetical protein [Streptomyces]MDX3588839.1 hypothetical protein [Streptomyces europaeiscabiei]MDX3612202.1 hypothetical protein [Streptomyces europaeiscabiei]MDX3637143.1 hypothetical protein [Streptomyces europaeiscabiei]MDX3654865.1 hypothetical protein [Streptomyces europaeiscabiei]WUD30253.1 hypothetical protein OG858_01720 [Streptomyces europaeiscabiei]
MHGSSGTVTEGGLPARNAKGVRFLRMENGDAVSEIGSGSYNFGVDTSCCR